MFRRASGLWSPRSFHFHSISSSSIVSGSACFFMEPTLALWSLHLSIQWIMEVSKLWVLKEVYFRFTAVLMQIPHDSTHYMMQCIWSVFCAFLRSYFNMNWALKKTFDMKLVEWWNHFFGVFISILSAVIPQSSAVSSVRPCLRYRFFTGSLDFLVCFRKYIARMLTWKFAHMHWSFFQ